MSARRILVLGASGTIGRAVVRSLIDHGHEAVCLVRPRATLARAPRDSADAALAHPSRDIPDTALAGAELRYGLATDPASLRDHGLRGERFDALISCLASRTGSPADAWRIDYQAHVDALSVAREAGIGQMVLLSAICVQKPLLAFQQAKLAFERKLIDSGLCYSIVRPTAFFKSLSGQIERVRSGKPYLMFGNGELTRCKPVSDSDLARYLVRCLADPGLQNRVLPIGGPGPALTPREQGETLFRLLGREPRFRSVPVAMLDAICTGLSAAGWLIPALRQKAELAKIGRYYATESMLVLDPVSGRYDADATPSTGSDTLAAYYQAVLDGREAAPDLREHAVF
jgi:divinyl chlorophyllide a 8-vinyl-reductase